MLVSGGARRAKFAPARAARRALVAAGAACGAGGPFLTLRVLTVVLILICHQDLGRPRRRGDCRERGSEQDQDDGKERVMGAGYPLAPSFGSHVWFRGLLPLREGTARAAGSGVLLSSFGRC